MTVMLVRRTAKEIAAAWYELPARSDRFREFWPDIRQFVARNWPTFVEDVVGPEGSMMKGARSVLTDMLTNPSVAQHVKDEIFAALKEDHERQAKYDGPQHDSGRFALQRENPGKVEQGFVKRLKDLH